jgi:glycosyltransferase involved in cell wall biosynthesis
MDEAFAADDEVIVVDDCSSDDSASLAASAGARIVTLERNSGPAIARNRAVREAKNEIVFFLDSDTLLEPGSLAAVKAHFERSNEGPIVNGLCSMEPLRDGIGQRYKALVEFSWHADMLERGQPPTIFNSRVGAMRRDVFLQTGGLDERIRGAELEEHEFSYRLPKSATIKLDPRIVVRHDFPDIRNTVRVYVWRAAKWAELFSDYRRFDNSGTGGTSFGNGIGHLVGAAIPLCLVLGLLNQGFAICGVGMLGAFLWVYRGLFRLALRRGTLVTLEVLILHVVYSYVILCGVALGFLRVMFGRVQFKAIGH